MSTDTRDVIWSATPEWPEDSVLTDTVIEESKRARRELAAAVERCQEARGAR